MTIEERLELLERELARANRRLTWLAIAAALAMCIVVVSVSLLAGAGGTRPERITLADMDGVISAELVASPTATRLSLFANDGRLRAGLALFEHEGTSLHLLDEAGEDRALLRVVDDGPRLELRDEDGRTRVLLKADSTGPSLVMYDEDGAVLWAAP